MPPVYGIPPAAVTPLKCAAAIRQPYPLGDTISAADILWGNALNWGMMFKLVPESQPIVRYVERITQRPAALKVADMDAKLAAEHERVNAASG